MRILAYKNHVHDCNSKLHHVTMQAARSWVGKVMKLLIVLVFYQSGGLPRKSMFEIAGVYIYIYYLLYTSRSTSGN